MQTNKAHPDAWEELFDQFHQKTEKFSRQIDRLHDDIGGAWTALKGHKQVLENIQATATEITQQANKVKSTWGNAHTLANDAGKAASRSLTEISAAAVNDMVIQITARPKRPMQRATNGRAQLRSCAPGWSCASRCRY